MVDLMDSFRIVQKVAWMVVRLVDQCLEWMVVK